MPSNAAWPVIDPLPDARDVPFFSVMIPTRNRTTFLADTLRSVLAQDPGATEMQIEVVDNCSTQGDPAAVVRATAAGRADIFRHAESLSMPDNWTSCIQRARGRWVHILNDDDMVKPGFYRAVRQAVEAHPEAGIIFCRTIEIDAEGREKSAMRDEPSVAKDGSVEDLAGQLARKNFIFTPSVLVARRAYESAGGFDPSLSFAPDWEMWSRIASAFPAVYIPEPLALYRVHAAALSAENIRTAHNVAESVKIIDICAERLPPERRAEARRRARRSLAAGANMFRKSLRAAGDRRASLLHAQWAWRLDPGPGRWLKMAWARITAGSK